MILQSIVSLTGLRCLCNRAVTAQKAISLGLFGLLALGAPGCISSAVRQGVQEALGAHGKYVPLRELPSDAIGSAGGIQFNPATTNVDAICPPKLLAEFNKAASRRAPKVAPLFVGGQPPLTVDTELVFFQERGLLGSAISLSRVRITAPGGKSGEGMIVTESQATLTGKADEMMEETIEALLEHLEELAREEREVSAGVTESR